MASFEEVRKEYEVLTNTLISRKIQISTMESCTAGLISSLITDTDNSSFIFKGGYVTYSNEAKIAESVPPAVIERYGVYSEQTAREMAKACRNKMKADMGVGVTGSLGIIDPANSDSVPGEVFIAIDYLDETRSFNVKVLPSGSKFLNKVFVADYVCREIMKMIDTNDC